MLGGLEMRGFRNCVTSFVMLMLAYGLAGCAWSPVEPYAGRAPRLQALYLIASGWHTEIAIRANALSGSLAFLRHDSRDAGYCVFG